MRRRSASVPVGMATKSVAPIPAKPRQLRGDRLLVADDRDVGRAGDPFLVEHRPVDGDVAVPRELLARGGPAVGLVVGDDGGQRDDDTR